MENQNLVYYHENKTKKKLLKVLKIVVAVLFIGIAVILLYTPITIIALQSFNASKDVNSFNGFSLQWYKELFHPLTYAGKNFNKAIMNTLFVTIIATVVSTILGTLFAIGINSLSRKKRQKMILLNNVPIVNADIVTGVTLMILLSSFISHLSTSTVLIAHIFFCIPYVVLSVLPKLSTINDNLYDAAIDLGCSPLKAVYKVIIPAIKSGILMGMLFAFTMSIDDFTISYFTGARLQSSFNVSTFIYLNSGKRTLSPSVYSYNTILTFGTLICLVIYNLTISIKNKQKNK